MAAVQFNRHAEQTGVIGEAIPRNSIVKMSSGKLYVCGATEKPIGVAYEREGFASGLVQAVNDVMPYVFCGWKGTRLCIASGVITAGQPVYTAASGQVTATANSAYYIGIAMSTSSAAGDYIEVAGIPKQTAESA